ncbi:hypothetical protein LCGC14_2382750 [marine sediment metagenome]|uniref:Uncharacterized protein n=1 Tax=marine sediment metagenome TaxID=412755 RepID=A0A0F9C0G8_9ZZZZ
MNYTVHRVGDSLCPYCMDDGPFVKQGASTILGTGHKRTYLECLRCGNMFIKHTKSKHTPVEVRISAAPA